MRDEQLERQIEVMVHRVANKVFPKYRFRPKFYKTSGRETTISRQNCIRMYFCPCLHSSYEHDDGVQDKQATWEEARVALNLNHRQVTVLPSANGSTTLAFYEKRLFGAGMGCIDWQACILALESTPGVLLRSCLLLLHTQPLAEDLWLCCGGA